MKKAVSIFALLAAVVSVLAGCGGRVPPNAVFSTKDLSGKTVGVLEGSAAPAFLGMAGSIRTYATADALLADLKNGALDCAVMDRAVFESTKAKGVKSLKEPLIDQEYRFAVARENPELERAMNEAIKQLKKDGYLEALYQFYLFGGEKPQAPQAQNVSGSLTLGVPADFAPFCYLDGDDKAAGLDVDAARAVCALLGVDLEVRVVSREELITNVEYGRVDFSAGGLVSPEDGGADTVRYTAPYAACAQVIVVRKK